jgi:predicted transposase/invertase (TIGR01784 family)
LDKDSDLKKQWCWIFNNLSIFAERPDNLDSSFNDLIEDARIKRLTKMDKDKYMEALQISDRDRKVIYEGGIIVGKHLGREEEAAKARAEKLVSAKAMLDDDVDIAKIAKYTGLSVEEVEALKQ